MMGQIWLFDIILSAIEFGELGRIKIIQRRRDIAARILCHWHLWSRRAICGQGVGASEVEGASARVVRRMRGARGGYCFLRSDGTVGADHARCDVDRRVAEEVGRNYIDDSQDGYNDTGGDHDAPVTEAQGFLACCLLVKVSENGDAEDGHNNSQSDEAGGGR